MYKEKNIVYGFGKKDYDDSGDDDDDKDPRGNYTVWVISKEENVVTPYTYDEAIGLAGHGSYTVGLFVVCCTSLLATYIDILSFPTVLALASCDLQLRSHQYTVLLIVPYAGAISTAYLWGFLSDTCGRRFCLLVCLWGGFVTSSLSAFSPEWMVLAVLKFIGVGFSSGVQSISYTLVGESCPVPVKRAYLFLLTCALHLAMPIYTALGYAFQDMTFSFPLGPISLTPWRLLVLCLATPLGACAACLHGFYESPKFLANLDGKVSSGLKVLSKICRRNERDGRKYSVEKLVLSEEGNPKTRSTSLLQSMWEQTVPLFRAPLLTRTVQLYFLTMVGYFTTNLLFTWLPNITNAVITEMTSQDASDGVCRIIEHAQNGTGALDSLSCTTKTDSVAIWASNVQALASIIINIGILWIPNRKALVIGMLSTMLMSSVSCAVIPFVTLWLSPVCFIPLVVGAVFNGVMASYFVDFFPTSYRGMAASLSILVAGGSCLVGSTVTGLFITTSCTNAFYAIVVNTLCILCGVLVACFLPSENIKMVS